MHEIHVDLGDGRRRRGTNYRDGLRLVDIVGPLNKSADLDAATLDDLIGLTGQFDAGFLDSTGRVDPDIAQELQAKNRLANEIFGRLLRDGPQLEFRMGEPEDWIREVSPAWYADDMHISKLPSSQQTWARHAIALTNVRRSQALPSEETPNHAMDRPLIFLCDEPERGLHRILEHDLARGLSEVMRLLRGAALVATHSPDLLASPLVRPVLVFKHKKRGSQLRRLPLSVVDGRSSAESAGVLGMSVGDLWALTRLTIVVEGIHDEWVFKTLLRGDIDAATAALMPIHGGARLKSLADARLVVDGTDAPVLVVLDDLDAEIGSAALARVKSASLGSDAAALRESLEDLHKLGKTNDSLLFLHQFASRAAEIGSLERVSVHGLSLPDVICYLDPDTLLNEPRPWTELIDRWTAEAAPGAARNIKKWLGGKKLLPQSGQEINERVERAALQMHTEGRALHHDLVGLGLRIRELSLGSLDEQPPGPEIG